MQLMILDSTSYSNCIQARNEYLLCMDAANASLHKYYVDDLSDLIDCMDYGLHQSLAGAVLARSDAIKQVSTPRYALLFKRKIMH